MKCALQVHYNLNLYGGDNAAKHSTDFWTEYGKDNNYNNGNKNKNKCILNQTLTFDSKYIDLLPSFGLVIITRLVKKTTYRFAKPNKQ
jgi:hypothetical protein